MAIGDAFVGRGDELAQLVTFLDDAERGVARVVLVTGEPGIGKTRLLEELERTIGERATVVWGRSWDEGVAPAYWPWIQVLRNVSPSLLERLRAPAATAEPEARFALFDAVGNGLRDAGVGRPLVIVLDDVHAADPSSLSLLLFVARHVRQARLLVVVAYRDVEVRASDERREVLGRIAREAPTIELPRLLDDDVRSLLDAAGLGTQPEPIANYIIATTEGVPLFVHEVLRSLSTPDSLLASTTPLPDGVRGVIRQRLVNLPAAVRELLEAASVVGQTFSVGFVAAASAAEPAIIHDAMEAAARGEVVKRVAPGRYAFSHALVREVLYREIAGGERARMHGRIAEALERSGAESERSLLAHHALRAAPAIGTARAVEAAIAAARAAARLHAFEHAHALLARATAVLELAPPDPELRARLERALGEARGTPPEVEAPPAPRQELEVSRDGEVWAVRRGATVVRLKDMRGLHMLAKLVASPGQDIHVLTLASETGQSVDAGDAGSMLDREAVKTYRARLADLEDEAREAEAWNDSGRLERARTEIESLRRELSRAIGLGGRERRAGAAAERARVNVTRRLRDVIQRIAEQDERLGRELDAAVTTGTSCSYRPLV
jgi:hypothetical protein